MSIYRSTCLIIGVVGLAAASVLAEYDIRWWTNDSGAQSSTGGVYTLSGTVGQADASAVAALAGGNYSLTGGFWAVIPVCASFVSPDFDHDCDVDMTDAAAFEACATGTGFGPVSTPCEAADSDQDEDVDQADFAVLQRCFSGEGVLANPTCAD